MEAKWTNSADMRKGRTLIWRISNGINDINDVTPAAADVIDSYMVDANPASVGDVVTDNKPIWERKFKM